MNRLRLTIIFGLFALLISCEQNIDKNQQVVFKDSVQTLIQDTITIPKHIKYQSIRDVEKDSILDAWTDAGSFWLLTFKPGEVIYEFDPSCDISFRSEIINNEIVFYWALDMNCISDRGMSKKYKGIRNPEVGKPFGKVTMVNDSVLSVEYYYKDWVAKRNREEQVFIDTLFPSEFKKIYLGEIR